MQEICSNQSPLQQRPFEGRTLSESNQLIGCEGDHEDAMCGEGSSLQLFRYRIPYPVNVCDGEMNNKLLEIGNQTYSYATYHADREGKCLPQLVCPTQPR